MPILIIFSSLHYQGLQGGSDGGRQSLEEFVESLLSNFYTSVLDARELNPHIHEHTEVVFELLNRVVI